MSQDRTVLQGIVSLKEFWADKISTSPSLTLKRFTTSLRNEIRQHISSFRLSSRQPLFEHLVGPIMFTSVVGVGTYLLARHMRADPTQRSRCRRQTHLLFFGIMGANTLICILWVSKRSKVVNLFLNRYMLADIMGPAPCISMLGAMFSHMNIPHFLGNMEMMCLQSYALFNHVSLADRPYQLLHVYVTGGLIAALGSYSRQIMFGPYCCKYLGSSGAQMALTSFMIMTTPNRRGNLGRAVRVLIVASADIFCLGFARGNTNVGHIAHLTGLCFGWLAGLIYNFENTGNEM